MLESIRSAVRTLISGKTNSAAAVQSLFTKFLVLGLNASTSIIVARALSPAGRGEMSALQIWSGFLAGLLTLGLPSSLIFNLRRKPERSAQTVGASLLLSMLIAALIAIIGEIAVPMWLTKYPPIDIFYARCFLLSAPIPILLVAGRAALEADGKFSQSNLVFWSAPLMTLAALLTLAATHTLKPLTGSLAYVLGNVPALLWLLSRVWITYRPTLQHVVEECRSLLHYGFRSWGIDLLTALSLQADQVLVVRFLDPRAMGIYVVAASFARLLSVFQTSAVMVLFPRIAARSTSEVLSLTGRTLRLTTSCAVACGLVIGFFGPVLLGGIYGHAYSAGGAAVFRILLVEVILGGATQVLAQAFMALGRPGVITGVQAIGVTTGVVLMPTLILHYGIAGAAAALAISSGIRLTLTLLCFQPLLKVAPPPMWMTREDVDFVLVRFARFVPARAELREA